jgi:hypothetical protein
VSKTIIVDIVGYAFPPIVIQPDTYVVWRNLDPVPHTVETDPDVLAYFNVGALATGEVSSPVWFHREGYFPYQCRFHEGMTGTVQVTDTGEQSQPKAASLAGDPMGGMPGMPGMGLQHTHGFVTGGRSGARLYMTHTPVIADDRHRFQVILRGHFVDPANAATYEALRAGPYSDGRFQILHDHVSLPDIAAGKIVDLPNCYTVYDPPGLPEETPTPGLERNIPVHIDQVLHFHQIDPDAPFPDGLKYILYGDADDIFIDHNLIGAPTFHSVAKLARRPAFWTDARLGGTAGFLIPSKRIQDVSPKVLRRVAFVDNAYHLSWLPPSGAYRQPPPDPLIPRDKSDPTYHVIADDGSHDQIQIGRFVHFDVALLDNRVVITP